LQNSSLKVRIVGGSTSAVKKAAAKQIGEIQKSHPDDLQHLLAKVWLLCEMKLTTCRYSHCYSTKNGKLE
jgi:hypothetical protein